MTFTDAALKILFDAGPEVMFFAVKAFSEMKKETVTSADVQALPIIGNKPFIEVDKDHLKR